MIDYVIHILQHFPTSSWVIKILEQTYTVISIKVNSFSGHCPIILTEQNYSADDAQS